MQEFDAILFDFDGVLADTEPVHFACWAEALAPLGIRMEWDFFERRCAGVADSDMVHIIAEAALPPRNWEDLWARYPEKKQLFRDRMLSAPPFAPELGGFLEELHRGYRMAVVTASARSEIEPLLEAGGLSRCFDALVCGKEAGKNKPEPDPYLLGAKLLKAGRPLVVEDSESGLASARAAGFESLRVPSAAQMPELLRWRLLSGADLRGNMQDSARQGERE
jgi:HAD superfamily hydrolase (TIGR01509 family)